MPRFPDLSRALRGTSSSLYSTLASRLEGLEREIYPLHIGDTWREPPEGCRMQDLTVQAHPGMHRYASPRGLTPLLDLLARRSRERGEPDCQRDNVLVTAGATGGLACLAGALLEPGDEVLLAAPFWPLIPGIVRAFGGTPVPVPLPEAGGAAEVLAALESHRTPRTVALYCNTPGNPTGRVLPREWVEALVAWAAERELWVLADEVYEEYVYRGRHEPVRPLDPSRVLSVHSFSKTYGMAGNRCGWVVGPPDVIEQAGKIATHTFYSTPTAAQIAAQAALSGAGQAWLEETREAYRHAGSEAARALGVPPPDGSTFLFLDAAPVLDERGLDGFLVRCADRGLLVAPGSSFGPYPTWIRVCFTSAPPEVTARGMAVLAELLGR